MDFKCVGCGQPTNNRMLVCDECLKQPEEFVDDNTLNNRFNAISGKCDIILTRQQAAEIREHDMLARLAHLEQSFGLTHAHMKLGKKRPKIDSRTLQFAKYQKALAPPNPVVDWSGGLNSWGMMLNDELGDCTIAGCGHAVTGLKMAAGLGLDILPDWVIEDYYETWDGYVPGNPSTDQGGVEIEVLNNWRKYGFGYRRNKQGSDLLTAYASVNQSNHVHVMQAVQNFGGLYIGLALPITAQGQSVWTVVGDGQTGNSAPGSWGGHCVWVVGYTPNYVTVVTWGQLLSMTWGFWDTYVDESYVLVSPDFVNAKGLTPSGFDMPTMLADMQEVTN